MDDVRIGEVVTEVTVTGEVGPLAPEDVKKLVALVLEHVREERRREAERGGDTRIADRRFQTGL